MSASFSFRGLCPAAHTPMNADGSLNLDGVAPLAAHLARHGLTTAFICGTTGESSSLTLAERAALSDRWAKVGPQHGVKVVVHVGSNCLDDAAELAARAERNRADAVSMIAPSYFRPRTLEDLVACCEKVARGCPDTPFYYYDIPAMTGISGFPVDAFLEKASRRIPNLAGVKYSNPDLDAMRRAATLQGGRFDLPFGIDERYLEALDAGARGGVGSTYNFMPGVLRRIIEAHARGDRKAAEAEQARVPAVVEILAKRGYLGAAKALMRELGVPIGPARLPNGNPSAEELRAMLGELDAMGYFSWKD